MHTLPQTYLIFLFEWICRCIVYASFTDENVYTQGQIEFQVFENASIGSTVIKDIRDQLQLSFDRQIRLGPGSLSSYFHLTNDFKLVVAKSLNLEGDDFCHAVKSCCRKENSQMFGDNDPFLKKNELGTFKQNRFGNFLPDTRECKLSAVVLANKGGSTPLKPISRISAKIKDVNDNVPIFSLLSRDVEISATDGNSAHTTNKLYITFIEGPNAIGERFELPTAVDSDFLPENSLITYSLSMKTPSNHETQKYDIPISASKTSSAWTEVGPFRLVNQMAESSLFLEVVRELDREVKDEYQLVLHADDPERQRTNLNLQINVLDVNEFSPTFIGMKQLGNVEVSELMDRDNNWRIIQLYENASIHKPIVQIIAEDKDASPANQIVYKLGPSFPQNEILSTFSLEPHTGKLLLESPLDYERTKRYKLSILAIDGNVEDKSTENQFLSEAAKKSFKMIAESIRSERKTATMTLDIRVLDCNDNAPEIKLQGTVSDSSSESTIGRDVLEVMENSPPGTSIVYFSAVDRDLGEYGQTKCELLNWTDRFQIHKFPDFYSLETTGELDREELAEYLLTIECSDSGQPILSSKKNLRIILIDENDEAPQFQHPVYAFHVQEGNTSGVKLTPIGEKKLSAIKAIDKDINSSITYHLEPSTSSTYDQGTIHAVDQSTMFDYQMFTVDASTAQLFTKSPLDREIREVYRFSLCASDKVHKTCTSIIVNLDDINDNPPHFERETYIIRLVENEQIFKPLIVFNVEDADIGNQGFAFTLEPPHSASQNESLDIAKNVQSYFSIRENKLFLRKPLDRETQAHHHFFIRVTDSQKHGRKQDNLFNTAEVFIEVADTNDNAPVFIFPSGNAESENGNRLNVSCRETMGSFIGQIEAVDLDLGQNGTVVYSVIEGPISNKLFYLDKQSGKIFINSGDLIKSCDSVFLLVVSADDQGPPESKKSRPIPVERLLIRLQNQPTLAELMSTSSRQFSDTSGSGRSSSRENGGYLGLPAKTMLSVVLGGCIVFLAGLFLAWVILLLFNRSKRRRREDWANRDYQSQRCFDVGTLSMGSNQEVLVHPIGTYSHSSGIPTDISTLKYTADFMKKTGKKNTNMSSRTSPCGNSLNAGQMQILGSGGRDGVSTTLPTSTSHNRNSPYYKTLNDNNGPMGTWKMDCSSNCKAGGEALAANIRTIEGKDRCCSPADSTESARYLLFPGASSAAETGTPPSTINRSGRESTLPPKSVLKISKYDSDQKTATYFRSNSLKYNRDKQRCQSQHFPQPYIVIDPQVQMIQSNNSNVPAPFLTPPEKRDISRDSPRVEVLQNQHFMFPESEYTSLLKNSIDHNNPNQYLVISSNVNNVTPSNYREHDPLDGRVIHNASGHTFSLLRSGRQYSKSSTSSISQATSIDTTVANTTNSPNRQQLIFTKIDGHDGVLVLPSNTQPEPNNSTQIANKIIADNNFGTSDDRRMRTQRATPDNSLSCPTEYISLEDLLNSCV